MEFNLPPTDFGIETEIDWLLHKAPIKDEEQGGDEDDATSDSEQRREQR